MRLQKDGMTLHEDHGWDGPTIRIRFHRRNPVIYLYPPMTLGVPVKLGLIPDLGGVFRYLFAYSDQGGRSSWPKRG